MVLFCPKLAGVEAILQHNTGLDADTPCSGISSQSWTLPVWWQGHLLALIYCKNRYRTETNFAVVRLQRVLQDSEATQRSPWAPEMLFCSKLSVPSQGQYLGGSQGGRDVSGSNFPSFWEAPIFFQGTCIKWYKNVLFLLWDNSHTLLLSVTCKGLDELLWKANKGPCGCLLVWKIFRKLTGAALWTVGIPTVQEPWVTNHQGLQGAWDLHCPGGVLLIPILPWSLQLPTAVGAPTAHHRSTGLLQHRCGAAVPWTHRAGKDIKRAYASGMALSSSQLSRLLRAICAPSPSGPSGKSLFGVGQAGHKGAAELSCSAWPHSQWESARRKGAEVMRGVACTSRGLILRDFHSGKQAAHRWCNRGLWITREG